MQRSFFLYFGGEGPLSQFHGRIGLEDPGLSLGRLIMLSFLQTHYALIITVLFALDQALASIPVIESNSTFQVISNVLKWLKDKFVPSKE